MTDQHKKSIIYLVQYKGGCEIRSQREFDCISCFYWSAVCLQRGGDKVLISNSRQFRYERALLDLNKYFTEEEIFEAML